MPQHAIWPIALALLSSAALTAAERGGPDPIYTEDFSAFSLGPIDGQQGWSSPNPDAAVEEGLLDGPAAVAPLDQERDEWGLASPRFPARYGLLEVDVRVDHPLDPDSEARHQLATEDPATGLLNARIEFREADRGIVVRFNEPGAVSFTQEQLIGAYAPGETVRLGIETTPAGALRLSLDGALVFEGTEFAAALFGPGRAGKIGRLSAWSEMSSAAPDEATSVALDAIVFTPDPCPADLSGDGGVDVVDLALLLQRWRDEAPGGAGDLNADEAVDVADLVTLIGAFGPCGS